LRDNEIVDAGDSALDAFFIGDVYSNSVESAFGLFRRGISVRFFSNPVSIGR
jgi:hypothetical protein